MLLNYDQLNDGNQYIDLKNKVERLLLLVPYCEAEIEIDFPALSWNLIKELRFCFEFKQI